MDETAISTVNLDDAAAGTSILGLVADADIVVKGVMLILVLASLWCWAVIFDKSFRLARLQRRTTLFERAFWEGTPLDDLYRRVAKRADHPMAMMFTAAMEEWREGGRGLGSDAAARLIQRVGRVLDLTMDREVSALEKHLPSLATIGAVAPFIGLFGTVWGIMNSFQSIAVTENTTLAVVAPGIAEALFATALGLFAAIPAVVAYNKLSNSIDLLAGRMESFADEFAVVMSREVEASRVVA